MASDLIPDDVKAEMCKPWVKEQVDWYLTDMLRWLDYGYVFTDEQKEAVEGLKGGDDGSR